jgi:hypothetical protein
MVTMRAGLLCLVFVLLSCREAPSRASLDTGNISVAPQKVDSLRDYEQRWIPGQPYPEELENVSRFSARSHWFSDGRLLLWLDTSTSRAVQRTRRHFEVADSLVISTLSSGEFFTEYCRIGDGLADGQIGGTARTVEPEQWATPRLAWVFDTLMSRIRSIPPDSVRCAVPDAD